MPVRTGLVQIKPWRVVEVITVRATETPDTYRIIYDNKDLFSLRVQDQAELIEQASKAWRKMFPNSP